MDNLSPAQYDRFEAYRRHALPKQAVRKVNTYVMQMIIDANIDDFVLFASRLYSKH